MRKVIITFCIMLISTFCLNANSTKQIKEFTGTVVEPTETTTRQGISLGDDFWGVTKWVIAPGTFVRGPIYGSDGEVTKKGDILVKSETEFYEHKLQAAKADVLSCKGIMKDAEINYERCKKLVKTATISEKEKDEAEADLYRAKGDLFKALVEVKHCKYIIDLCTIRAPFSGYVENVFTNPGSMNNFDLPSYDAVVSLRRLSPMYIEVKMDRELARKLINQEYGITIQPALKHDPIGCFNLNMQLTDEGIKIPVNNYLMPLGNELQGKTVVHKLGCVLDFYKSADKSELAIPTNAVYKDKKGNYVWAAENVKLMQANTKMPKNFKIKKVYVKLGNELREGFGGRIQKLEDAGGLNEYDAVLLNNNRKLKDGNIVYFKTQKCLFWPGDKVKVSIS